MGTKKSAAKRAPAKIGRPSSFRPEWKQAVRTLCRMGATDKDLAEAFDVDERTVNNWKVSHPAFFQSIKAGKDTADDAVEASLYQRALGYEHDAVKILAYEGAPIVVPYRERYAPDTTAAIFWLKNRRPAEWREKQTIEHDVTDGLAEKLAAARKRVADG